MNLPPAVDASCRTKNICIRINSDVRREEKRLANRNFRRVLKQTLKAVESGELDWDDCHFGNLPRYTSWDIW